MSAMLKNIMIGAWVTLCVTACASSRTVPDTAKPPIAASTKQPPAGCVASTATRIPVSPQDCAGFGQTWTSQDVKATGAADAARVLRLLDPTVVVTH